MPSYYTIVLYQNIYADATNKTAGKLEEFKVNILSCSNWVDSCFGVVSVLLWTRKEERTPPSPRKHWQLWRSQRAALDVIGTLRRTCVCERKATLQKVVQNLSRHDELSCFSQALAHPHTHNRMNQKEIPHKNVSEKNNPVIKRQPKESALQAGWLQRPQPRGPPFPSSISFSYIFIWHSSMRSDTSTNERMKATQDASRSRKEATLIIAQKTTSWRSPRVCMSGIRLRIQPAWEYLNPNQSVNASCRLKTSVSDLLEIAFRLIHSIKLKLI